MLTVDIALPDIEELHKLVESGKEKGVLTYDEIVKGIEEVELTKEQIEDFTTYLIDQGVALFPRGANDREQPRSHPLDEPRARLLEVASPARDRRTRRRAERQRGRGGDRPSHGDASVLGETAGRPRGFAARSARDRSARTPGSAR